MKEPLRIVTRREAAENQLLHYYEGDSCRRGHFSERFTSTGACCECHRNYSREKRDLKRKEESDINRQKRGFKKALKLAKKQMEINQIFG